MGGGRGRGRERDFDSTGDFQLLKAHRPRYYMFLSFSVDAVLMKLIRFAD